MWIRRLAALACVLALACAGYLALDRWQRQMIFSVELGEHSWWREPPAGTEIYDLPLQGGDTLRTWYWQHPDPDAPTVLYLHGSRWNLNGSASRFGRWADLGHSMLAIDYRGFGASSPRLPSQASVREDAAAALRELARRQPDPARRFVYGHSLGGAIAIDLMARTETPHVAGLIAESTFTSIRDMATTTRWGHLPGLGLLVTQPFDSVSAIGSLRLPVLLMHGTADRVIPHTMSDTLWAAARQAPVKRLVKLEGASHSGASRSGPAYNDAVRDFIRTASLAYGG
ncbi:MAG: alpha/beta fold hydrolase [Pigmentiphaga sp.]|uniref:alpha/beta hydrolase n=1 Tax=Pigmentiphaga sp. TaxID=1977564 RepID=UPI0029AD6ABB|nr:alpha/beta fold hydrolase [Pigmentiphaga sp.]MDX3904424.1 alpha/beta fold hydrolase [Pigmentiphaga sp.]